MARVAYTIRRPVPSGSRISKFEIGFQEAGGTSVTEPIATVTIDLLKLAEGTAAEESAFGAVTLTALMAVTDYHTKTEI